LQGFRPLVHAQQKIDPGTVNHFVSRRCLRINEFPKINK
jgi:hypothetical protein